MASKPVDLLLLNGSNYPGQPIFPYAFVQVSALARQYGLSVARHDFLGSPKADWSHTLEHLIATHAPRMVGFHVRQADSQYLDEYKRVPGSFPRENPYFPVDDTKALIEATRGLTSAPIVVGGFGFTTHAEAMFRFLNPDYGVRGDPDAFFGAFEPLARRDLSHADAVGNLIYRDGESVCFGPRAFFAPLAACEYDDEIFSELCQFYARIGRQLSIGTLGDVDVPVEVMRGCPCKCYFCTEPHVKGRTLRQRDIDVVMADVEFLAARDVRCVWFICSEINIGGMDFPLRIASRMAAFNAGRGSRRVLWKAYNMPQPGMSRDHLRTMMMAGYIPGWNEFTSFEDQNLARAKMPYRSKRVVQYFKDVLELSRDPAIYLGPPMVKFDIFLGNAHIDAHAIRSTLAIIDREGFQEFHSRGHSIMATRVYEHDGQLNCGSSGKLVTIGPHGVMKEPDLLRPTFHYAPELLRMLGTIERVGAFMHFLGQTFISHNHRLHLDIPAFLASVISPEEFAKHLEEHALMGFICATHLQLTRPPADSNAGSVLAAADALAQEVWQDPTAARIRALFHPSMGDAAIRNLALRNLLRVLLSLHEPAFQRIYDYLGVADEDSRRTPYRIMKRLYERFDSNDSLIEEVCTNFSIEPQTLDHLHLLHFLYEHNVHIDPAYRPLLFETSSE